jgi:hypothetical protein
LMRKGSSGGYIDICFAPYSKPHHYTIALARR